MIELQTKIPVIHVSVNPYSSSLTPQFHHVTNMSHGWKKQTNNDPHLHNDADADADGGDDADDYWSNKLLRVCA